MAGVIFTLGLVVTFVVALRMFWVRAVPQQETSEMSAEDGRAEESPAKMPWGARRQRRYIDQGVDELERWMHRNARRPDAGT